MDKSISRRSALQGLIGLPALGAAVLSAGAPARAGSSKAAVKYQGSPKNGQQCSGCRFFKAAKDPKANGTCQIVDGSISPNGWCIAFAKK
ncbi:MAG: high-potential iron-sulfur protein [Candidatus Eremiobacteraeota bacterium]|nr:high-potential iron-sulfur protein [Candidatus Eremiobacteraeota bacterium]